VGTDDTAWRYRDAVWSDVIGGIDPDPANAERIKERPRRVQRMTSDAPTLARAPAEPPGGVRTPV
jgi:hypothetical protein